MQFLLKSHKQKQAKNLAKWDKGRETYKRKHVFNFLYRRCLILYQLRDTKKS